MTPPLTLAVYAASHVLFWPPALAAEVVARRVNLSLLKRLLLVFAFSVVLPAFGMALLLALHERPADGWYGAIDELVGEAVATTLSYVLYRFLSTREPRIDLLRRA
jgi:multisubunit Na+/H+ antiporter MnhB subunit